jgi:hypothetical protein
MWRGHSCPRAFEGAWLQPCIVGLTPNSEIELVYKVSVKYMPKFSSKHGYDPRTPRTPILEDAPEWLRTTYLNQVLDGLTYVDMDSREENDQARPLGIKKLYEELCGILRQDPEQDAYDSWLCKDHLKAAVRAVEWYHFYDFVELVGQKLKKSDESSFHGERWLEEFGFETYQGKVNRLFSEDRIGWRLNDNAELGREVPKLLAKAMSQTEGRLRNEFAPAREHYQKAHRYIYERPVDPENAIKEVTSALESVGRVFFPNAQTLGAVLKEMKKERSTPSMLISMLEKFYAYACSEPAIRHGSPVPSRVLLADSEFCLHVGVATIRYLLDRRNDLAAK